MELLIYVTLRQGEQRRTRKYKSENSARRGIYQWLQQQAAGDVSASYFSPSGEHFLFDHAEQLAEFAPKEQRNFYLSGPWLHLRDEILASREHRCAICNKTQAEHNIAVEVDHILPRSKYPELALDPANLQILCFACNRGKRDKVR